ncbi:uncharacterized protein Z518_08862 [Rhinocladiella mackenziei CBS 650.93]|uniref:Bicarbonate transporter-like transmembrane domain-containing protein n=1 Tax=Rhinocladiella mackenziei CBS 650.93 TaxID=1442369 RepID=A0A0D2IAQ8_9EURO|nr:uncharacterized protein Z518_08862 [Rhinocladiella mackenziei CBS 650.93]KIX02919.1 hypothetical protein Z518_08862 [Rhinocladiella mackenziei CBS 650.93]
MVQARAFPLKKLLGFHCRLSLLRRTCLVPGLVDIPLPNDLIPQASVHTDSLTNYVDDVKEIKAESGAILVREETRAESVPRQRVSHFLMGLAITGTMTQLLRVMLHLMLGGVFAGAFFVVGWGSIEGNGIVKKILLLLREKRFQQLNDPFFKVHKRVIVHFIGWQLLIWPAVAISQTMVAIGFPVLIVALIPFRWVRLFSRGKLGILDNVTATYEVAGQNWLKS